MKIGAQSYNILSLQSKKVRIKKLDKEAFKKLSQKIVEKSTKIGLK